MPFKELNGQKLFYELTGSAGEPLVLVHGSWVDHHSWDQVTVELAKTFRVLTYDRRGHSQSERHSGQGYVAEDVADLIGLVEELQLAPAHIIGSSFGGSIVLKTAAKQPEVFQSLVVHEPPLFDLVDDKPEASSYLNFANAEIKKVLDLISVGKMKEAAESFVNKIALGPGSWEALPQSLQQSFANNATTWFDELQDPDGLQIDTSRLGKFDKPALLSVGTESPPLFPLVAKALDETLSNASQISLQGAGHVPHLSHPEMYIKMVRDFCVAA